MLSTWKLTLRIVNLIAVATIASGMLALNLNLAMQIVNCASGSIMPSPNFRTQASQCLVVMAWGSGIAILSVMADAIVPRHRRRLQKVESSIPIICRTCKFLNRDTSSRQLLRCAIHPITLQDNCNSFVREVPLTKQKND